MKRLIFDIETDGLLPELTKIHCICTYDPSTKTLSAFGPDEIDKGIEHLNQAEILIGHNIIGFDVPAIQKVHPAFNPSGKFIDTMVLSRLLWPDIKPWDWSKYRGKLLGNEIGSHGLKAWGKRLNLHKGECMNFQKFTPEMLEYCKQDVRVTAKLYMMIRKEKPTLDSVTLEHEFAQILNKQVTHGFHFDVERAENLTSELTAIKSQLKLELREVFPSKIIETEFIPKRDNKTRGYKAGVPFIKTKVQEFNPSSREQIGERLIEQFNWQPKKFTETGKPEVSETILDRLATKIPIASKLSQYLLIDKRLGQTSNGRNGWLKCVKEGRIHGGIIHNGTPTGRCRHMRPNIGQTPAVKTNKETKAILWGKEGSWHADSRACFTVPR